MIVSFVIEWTYEILIMDEKRNMSHVEKSISSTDVTVHNLRPDTEYRVKVAAYTISGRGKFLKIIKTENANIFMLSDNICIKFDRNFIIFIEST